MRWRLYFSGRGQLLPSRRLLFRGRHGVRGAIIESLVQRGGSGIDEVQDYRPPVIQFVIENDSLALLPDPFYGGYDVVGHAVFGWCALPELLHLHVVICVRGHTVHPRIKRRRARSQRAHRERQTVAGLSSHFSRPPSRE